MSPSGTLSTGPGERKVWTYTVHSSENNEIGEVEECSCVHGVQPEHFVAYAYKLPDDSESRYWLDTYEELDTAEMAVADEYDGLGPFEEELGEEEAGYTWEV